MSLDQVDERMRVQSGLYPWTLLSVLNARSCSIFEDLSGVSKFPTTKVVIGCKESEQLTIWCPASKSVTFESIDVLSSQTFPYIGIVFNECSQAVGFFEDSRLKGLSMKGWHRGIQFKRFFSHLLSIQSLLGVKHWEKLSEATLLLKIKLTLFAAVEGLNGLSILDSFTNDLMSHLPNGVMRIDIGGLQDPLAYIQIQNGKLRWHSNHHESLFAAGKSVDFSFKDLKSAWMCVANLSDNLAAVGKGDICLRGYIPIVDGFNHMLDRLQIFVKAG